jgi:hypothetical protein
MAYKLLIDHLYRCNTKEKPSIYEQTIKEFQDMDKLKDFLKENYYNIKLKPTIRNTLFIDDIKGNTHKIGLTYSYWDIPYKENRKVLNTDLITISKIEYSNISESEFKNIFKGD